MNDQTDQQLLRAYAAHRSEPAFAELVRRHVDLVYSAALRMVCDAHLAQDVTQATFVALAQNAGQLADRPVLSGWLHRTAQNLASKTVRTDVRRRQREQEAATMNDLLATAPDVPWEQIAPHLDVALSELSEPDRDAVLLRYFEKKSADEMAARLGISAEAAQKRLNRAIEKLRASFARRGVTVGTSGLVIVISANAVQAAPAGLALTIATAVTVTGATLVTTASVTATKAIAMTTLQKAIFATTIATLAGVALYEVRHASQLRKQVQTLQQQHASEVQQLQDRLANATNRLTNLVEESSHLKANLNQNELLKLRGEANRLRSELAAAQSANNASKQQAHSSSAPTMFTFPAGQTFQLDPAKLSAAGIKATTPVNLEFKDVSEFQNAGNATVEAGAQTALWEVLKNEGRGFDKIATPGLDTADDTAAKLYGHLAVELSGASHVAFEKPAQMSQDLSLVNFFASWPKDQNGNSRSTSGLLGLRRQGEGWYLDRFTPQSQGLMIKSPAAFQK